MINILIIKIKHKINKIEINGHSKSNKYGYDLICAAITGISVGGLNVIDKIRPNSCKFIIKKGLIIIIVKNNSIKLQIILQTIYYQLLTIYKQYKRFIYFKEI